MVSVEVRFKKTEFADSTDLTSSDFIRVFELIQDCNLSECDRKKNLTILKSVLDVSLAHKPKNE